MLNTIGMSESILKMIEKRTKTDMIIFFGLAVLTLLLIYILVWHVKPWLSATAG
jgi:predicted nucleic acid-binding Zn ribbon protein